MKQELKVKNIFGEKLDVLIEGNEQAEEIIIFVHGFGVDKDSRGLFLDIKKELEEKFLICRFDQSGCGKTEGAEIEYHQFKSMGDLKFILNFLRKKYPQKKINIIAHSMGGYITALLSPENIKKAIFISAENLDSHKTAENIKKFIVERGGKFQGDGSCRFPRRDGSTWKIGRKFWQILENNNYQKYLEDFSKKTNLLIIKAKQDEIIGHNAELSTKYQKIKTLQYLEIDGDHNFTKAKDRKNLIKKITEFMIK